MAKIRITLEGYRCERCRHEWVPRAKDYPIICPKCKSPYWDRPKSDRSVAAKKAWETRRKKAREKKSKQ